jgi:bifunctional DNA-binding transcriptional regulator/antitoxin component of YhaV-PrlF toxin-antitoxin module
VALVKLKEKYQVTLPAEVCKKADLTVGDFLEAKVQGKIITLVPKNAIDRDIAISLREFRQGKGHGPFSSAKKAIRVLHREVKRLKKKSP